MVARLTDLKPGQTLKFRCQRKGREVEGFFAWFNGRIVAYQNLCRHIPISLDFGDNKIFAPDGQSFICQPHGAVYDPETGQCLSGPCGGASLHTIRFREYQNELWVEEN
jgi:nitrite reductase/ring-hydroxylating ferredoxin subunit